MPFQTMVGSRSEREYSEGNKSRVPTSLAQCTQFRNEAGPVMSPVEPRALGRYLWIINLLVDILILTLSGAIMLFLALIEDEQSSLTTNEDIRLPIFATSSSLELLICIIMSIILVWFRHEPEIQSRNEAFVLQIITGSLIALTTRLLTVYIVFQTDLDADATKRWYTTSTRAIGVISYIAVPSALTLRLRLIYLIMCCENFQPLYSTGVLWHIPIIVLSGLPILVCGFAQLKCSVAVTYSGTLLAWSTFVLQFGYYLYWIRPVSGLFIDIWSNFRVFIFMLCGSLSFNLFLSFAAPRSVVLDSHLIWYAFLLYIAWSEAFAACLIKVLGRRLGTGWLHDVDLRGVTHTYIQTDHVIESVFEDIYLREAFECLSRARHFEESYTFMFRWWSLQNSASSPELKDVELRGLVESHVLGVDHHMRINISHGLRQAVEAENEVVSEKGQSTERLRALLADVAEELKVTLREHIIALYNQESVVVHCQQVTAFMRVGLVL